MKRLTSSLGLLLALAGAASLVAAEHLKAGPKGGRLLEAEGQTTEFLVTPDRRLAVNFYDAQRQPLAPAGQVVTVIAEEKSGRTKLNVQPTAHGFVTTTPLPESAEPMRVILQLRRTADARPQNFRIDVNLAVCGECKLQEYACTCEGH